MSKKTDKDVTSFARQAATDVASRVCLQYLRGGRSLEVVPEECSLTLRQSLQEGVAFRPQQCGNLMLPWISEHVEDIHALSLRN